MSFIETPRFPEDISYGAVGGPGFSTEVVVVASGNEFRNVNWDKARASYDVSHGVKTPAQMKTLVAYFRAMHGRAHGFRYKDWADYQATTSEGIIGTGVGDGTPTLQLRKKYTTGSLSESRDIKKPVSAAVYKNAVLKTAGVDYTLDTTTGIVTWTATSTKSVDANSAKSITNITKANPGQVTSSAHGFTTGDKIKITSVAGMTQVNGNYYTITVVDANNYTIGVDTSSYGAYTSGGTGTKHGITQTSPARVYSASHGFTNGQLVYLTAAAGMPEVNNLAFTVANASTNYFDLSGVNATAYGTYTGSGSIALYPQPGDALTWSGEFDVPVRFDIDEMKVSLVDKDALSWNSIPLVELRA